MKQVSQPSQTFTDPELDHVLEEIADAISAGRLINVEAYTARMPQHAEQLRNFVTSMQLLADFGDANSACDHDQQPLLEDVVPTARVLGDFRILGELGRGGMGIVYEAQQISLERTVALKILPFAAILDDRQLQRFKNEARAAATLHHPHIVPVFSVGSERGVHYYAMQRVDGATLAEVLSGLRGEGIHNGGVPDELKPSWEQPTTDQRSKPLKTRVPVEPVGSSRETRRELQAALSTRRSNSPGDYFRTVARWGLETAEALAYAHENGVLHRDIKPGNLMLDRAGKIWVTDFGLARIESEASMTMTGDIVGTLTYMAPEQALAKRVLVDHRADIYSLGVTLYELATTKPAFTGNDRQEVLQKIAFEEPVNPRKIDQTIPVDLETIILKAAAKSPEDRYASAQDLADDLKQFLSDRPILAKPPTIVERARKWTKRHPAITWSAAIILLLITLFSISGFVWTRQKNAQLAEAVLQSQRKTTEANQALARETAALSQAQSANQRTQQALEAARNAEAQAKKNFYLSTMRQAYADLQQGDSGRFAESMVRFIPSSGEKDLRGWEWYYLQALYQQAEQVLHLHTGVATATAWHPRGRYLATAGGSGVICLWDPGTWKPVATFTSHGVRSISWHPSGELIAASHLDGIIRVWDTRSGLVRQEIVLSSRGKTGLPPSRCDEVAFSPDGTKLAATVRVDRRVTSEDQQFIKGCRVWDTDSFREIWSYEPAEANSLSWSPDGRRLAFSEDTDRDASDILILDANNGELIDRITGCDVPIAQVRWSPAGDRIAACEYHRGIKIFDAESHELLNATTVDSLTENICWSPDGERLAVGEGRVVQIYNRELAHQRSIKGHTGNMMCLAWDTHGSVVAAGATDGMVRIWHLDRELNSIGARPVCADIFDVNKRNAFFSRSRRFLATLHQNNKSIVVRRVSDGAVVKHIDLERAPLKIAWSGDDARLACVSHDGREVTIIDLADGHLQSLVSVAEGKVHDVDWNPVNSRIAAAIETKDKAGRIDIWNAEFSEVIRSISVGEDAVVGVAWDPLGRRLASVESAGTTAIVRIWSATDDNELCVLTGHDRQTGKLQWRPTGDLLAAFGWDGRVTIWDTQHGQLHCKLHGHTRSLRGAWHPTEERFMTHGDDGTVRLWDVASGEEILRIDQEYESLMFDPTGGKLYLLGKSLDVVDLSSDPSGSPELLEFAAIVNMNREDFTRARSLIDTIDEQHSNRQFLLRRLFNRHIWKAGGRDAAIEHSAPHHLTKALELWQTVINEHAIGQVPEYGESTIYKLSNALSTVAINAPSTYRHYKKDPRMLLPTMEEVHRTIEQQLPRERLAPGEEKGLQDWLNLLARRIREEEKVIPLVPGR